VPCPAPDAVGGSTAYLARQERGTAGVDPARCRTSLVDVAGAVAAGEHEQRDEESRRGIAPNCAFTRMGLGSLRGFPSPEGYSSLSRRWRGALVWPPEARIQRDPRLARDQGMVPLILPAGGHRGRYASGA